jgi:hypothetical protein
VTGSTGGSLATFAFPGVSGGTSDADAAGGAAEEDEEDLYS